MLKLNTASRKVSRLAKKVKSLETSAAASIIVLLIMWLRVHVDNLIRPLIKEKNLLYYKLFKDWSFIIGANLKAKYFLMILNSIKIMAIF